MKSIGTNHKSGLEKALKKKSRVEQNIKKKIKVAYNSNQFRS